MKGLAPDPETALVREKALAEIHRSAKIALLFCFMCPPIAAFFLHQLRSQLSRPSEGLISNLNLTIFVLVAELRPAAEVGNLVRGRAARLHNMVVQPLCRLEDLNSKYEMLLEDVHNLTALVQRALEKEAEVDAMNRAIRRYEKKEALFASKTENKMLELDSRVNDIMSTVVAPRPKQRTPKKTPSLFGRMISSSWNLAMIPFNLAWGIASYPLRLVNSASASLVGNKVSFVPFQVNFAPQKIEGGPQRSIGDGKSKGKGRP